MGSSTKTPTLTALLCLGLCWDPWNRVQAGVPPKPSIWADPGAIVTKENPVTIWCQGSLQADVYRLYEKRTSTYWDTAAPRDYSNKAGFFIESMSAHTAGLYQCAYHTSWNRWSERSDPLPLVVTGVYSAPSLSAHPGPVVASGENVSLSCSSQFTFGTFHLLKGGADPPRHMESSFRRRGQAVFPVGPVNTSHGGTYRCYGSPSSYPYVWSLPSDPLHLEVTGVYREPSLSAQPGSLVLSGDNLTLQCHSEAGFDRFALSKDEGLTPPQRLQGQHSPDFPLGHVNYTHGGQYRCYGGHSLSYAWSAPSAPLDILIAGIYKKPSLSAQLGRSVSWGENVTLQCCSEIWLDTFHLSKERSLGPPQHLRLQDMAAPFQANFSISPVTSDHEGTYRCYGSNSTSPYLLSLPSDPLELRVSGGTEDGLSSTESGTWWDNTVHVHTGPTSGCQPSAEWETDLSWEGGEIGFGGQVSSVVFSLEGLTWYLKALIGVSVAFVLLLSLLLLLLFRHRRQGKHRSVAAATLPVDRSLQKSSRPAADVQEENLYAAIKDTQPEEGRQLDSQAVTSEDTQDVTYAQLNHLTLRRETTAPPSSLSREPPEELTTYAALAIH